MNIQIDFADMYSPSTTVGLINYDTISSMQMCLYSKTLTVPSSTGYSRRASNTEWQARAN